MQTLNYSPLFLTVEPGIAALIAVLAAIVAGVACFFLGMWLKNRSFVKKQGDIQKVTEKMLDDAREESKTIKREAILEAKEQEHKLRVEFERESKEKRAELKQMENRLNQKEESLDRKEDNLNKRNEETTKQQNALKEKHA